jgi:hypothetical protein
LDPWPAIAGRGTLLARLGIGAAGAAVPHDALRSVRRGSGHREADTRLPQQERVDEKTEELSIVPGVRFAVRLRIPIHPRLDHVHAARRAAKA